MSEQREFHPLAYDTPNCNCRKLGLNPMFCMTGHLLECHYPYSCEEVNCSHFQAEGEIDE